jgi:G3E family GTPase
LFAAVETMTDKKGYCGPKPGANEVAIGASDDDSCLRSIVRAKGFAWLASHYDRQAVVSYAGNRFDVSPGSPWWASVNRDVWPEGLHEAIAPLWHEPHGDRQVELVIIGKDMDADAIRRCLNTCLCTTEEIFEIMAAAASTPAQPQSNHEDDSEEPSVFVDAHITAAWTQFYGGSERDPFNEQWVRYEQEMQAFKEAEAASGHHNHDHDHDHHH